MNLFSAQFPSKTESNFSKNKDYEDKKFTSALASYKPVVTTIKNSPLEAEDLNQIDAEYRKLREQVLIDAIDKHVVTIQNLQGKAVLGGFTSLFEGEKREQFYWF